MPLSGIGSAPYNSTITLNPIKVGNLVSHKRIKAELQDIFKVAGDQDKDMSHFDHALEARDRELARQALASSIHIYEEGEEVYKKSKP